MKISVNFPCRQTARYFQASLFREAALTSEINGTTAVVNFRTKRELSKIQSVANMYNRQTINF